MVDPIKELYSDLDRRFVADKYGKLAKVVDLASIEQSIDTIILTPIGSRKFEPAFGSSVQDLLFENIGDEAAILLSNEIRRAINRWDTRITVNSVIVLPLYDENSYTIRVEGYATGFGSFHYSRKLTGDAN